MHPVPEVSKHLFSFHLLKVPLLHVPQFLRRQNPEKTSGLLHAEPFFTMNLGQSVLSPRRYNLSNVALFAWWKDEASLDLFLHEPEQALFREGWHVRMKLYRRWGMISALKEAAPDPAFAAPEKPVVAVTLARLNLLQTARFIKWGKPVEKQVRDHKGQTLALAALRPLNTFSTFSIWKNEEEMLNMVAGRKKAEDGESHRLAMQERIRKDFHHEFTTMRFTPIAEVGLWNGRSDYTLSSDR